ncbi:MAG TPA: hypothetical protein VFI34_04365 [Candidatus Limnocylindrales bacterium]|nr:hypothetical protein [Candidatus Limnocylindrales bacterium]
MTVSRRLAPLVAGVVLALVAGCANPPDRPSVDPRALAVEAAERLTSIHGPWTVGEVQLGRYADLWRGAAHDPGDPADPQRPPDRVVWRIDLSGPEGIEELYLDATTSQLVDAITQGR